MNKLNPKLTSKHLFKNEISIFLEVCRLESMSKAAESLGISQPNISKAVRKLEAELGLNLLSRNRNGVKQSSDGRHLRRILEQMRDQLQLENKKAQTQHISIACHQSVAMEVFPFFIPQLRKLFSESEMSFQFMTSLQATEKVSSLEIDIGIVINPIKRRQIIAKPIKQDSVAYWVGESGPKSGASLLVHPDMIYPSRLKTDSAEMLQVPDYEVIAQMVKEGQYTGILPASIAQRHGLLQVGKKLFTVDLSLIFHEDRFDPQTARSITSLFSI